MKRIIAVIMSLVIMGMIAPQAAEAGGPALLVALAPDTPGSRDIVVNSGGVVALKAKLTAYRDGLKILGVKVKFFRIPIENGLVSGPASPAKQGDVVSIRLRNGNTFLTLAKPHIDSDGSVTFGKNVWPKILSIANGTTETIEVLFDLPDTTTATGLFAMIDEADVLLCVAGEQQWSSGQAKGATMVVKQQGFLGIYLSRDTPSNQVVLPGSTNVVFLKANFTAGATEDVRISELTIRRYGGRENDLGGISIWDGQTWLGSTLYLSNDEATLYLPAYSAWQIAKGTTKILTVRADIAANATDGDLVMLGLYGVKATGNTSGKTIVPEAFQITLSMPVIIAPQPPPPPSSARIQRFYRPPIKWPR